ncbi:MAG: metallophosphoesterase [Chloroflexi bacterium]|nr:metallophosphoesterase [Chloroflexota bacterium]
MSKQSLNSEKLKSIRRVRRENQLLLAAKVFLILVGLLITLIAIFSAWFFGTEGPEWDRSQVMPEKRLFQVPLDNGRLELSSCHFIGMKQGEAVIRALGPSIKIKAQLEKPPEEPLKILVTNIQAENSRIYYGINESGKNHAGTKVSQDSPVLEKRVVSPTEIEIEWKPAGGSSLYLSWDRTIEKYKIMVFGDPHYGWSGRKEIIEKIIQAAYKEKPEFIVLLGDMTASSKKRQFEGAINLLASSPVPVFTVCGNHELQNMGRVLYQEYLGPLFYSSNFDGTHLVFLDTSTGLIYPEELEWVNKDLSENAVEGDKKAIIFQHVPPYDPRPWGYHQAINKEDSERMADLYHRYKVSGVFCGHVHGSYRYKIRNIPVIITGGAGAPLIGNPGKHGFFHYTRAIIDSNGNIETKPVRITGMGASVHLRVLNSLIEPTSYFFREHPVILVSWVLIFLAFIIAAILRKDK